MSCGLLLDAPTEAPRAMRRLALAAAYAGWPSQRRLAREGGSGKFWGVALTRRVRSGVGAVGRPLLKLTLRTQKGGTVRCQCCKRVGNPAKAVAALFCFRHTSRALLSFHLRPVRSSSFSSRDM